MLWAAPEATGVRARLVKFWLYSVKLLIKIVELHVD